MPQIILLACIPIFTPMQIDELQARNFKHFLLSRITKQSCTNVVLTFVLAPQNTCIPIPFCISLLTPCYVLNCCVCVYLCLAPEVSRIHVVSRVQQVLTQRLVDVFSMTAFSDGGKTYHRTRETLARQATQQALPNQLKYDEVHKRTSQPSSYLSTPSRWYFAAITK